MDFSKSFSELADAVCSSIYRSDKLLNLNEELCLNTCYKCIYLEERLKAILSELCSMKLAIELLYTELNKSHIDSEVRAHPVLAHNEVSVSSPWCTAQSECNRLGKKAGRTEILQSYNMFKQCKYQHSQHNTQQEAIQIDTRRGSESCQKYDSRASRIPTVINGYTDPQNWRDGKRLNSDGVLNALKITDKSEKKEGNRNTVVGEESMIVTPPPVRYSKKKIQNTSPSTKSS
jgi:hypothetical protein